MKLVRESIKLGNEYNGKWYFVIYDDNAEKLEKVEDALRAMETGASVGYTQSDEITLVLVDYQRIESMVWYGNQVQKMCSVAASIATNAALVSIPELSTVPEVAILPIPVD